VNNWNLSQNNLVVHKSSRRLSLSKRNAPHPCNTTYTATTYSGGPSIPAILASQASGLHTRRLVWYLEVNLSAPRRHPLNRPTFAAQSKARQNCQAAKRWKIERTPNYSRQLRNSSAGVPRILRHHQGKGKEKPIVAADPRICLALVCSWRRSAVSGASADPLIPANCPNGGASPAAAASSPPALDRPRQTSAVIRHSPQISWQHALLRQLRREGRPFYSIHQSTLSPRA